MADSSHLDSDSLASIACLACGCDKAPGLSTALETTSVWSLWSLSILYTWVNAHKRHTITQCFAKAAPAQTCKSGWTRPSPRLQWEGLARQTSLCQHYLSSTLTIKNKGTA